MTFTAHLIRLTCAFLMLAGLGTLIGTTVAVLATRLTPARLTRRMNP